MPVRYGNLPFSWQYRGSGAACPQERWASRDWTVRHAHRGKNAKPGGPVMAGLLAQWACHIRANACGLHHARKADESRTGA